MFRLASDRIQKTDKDASLYCCYGMPYAAFVYGVVSVIAYSIWAFGIVKGQAPMYTTIALIYFGLSGLSLSRLVIIPGVRLKFCLFFAFAFLVYAVFWCLFWFGLKGRYEADLWGAAVGLLAMTWLFQKAFQKRSGFLVMFAVLFTCYTLGYYLGDVANSIVGGKFGKLLWGAGHGLGFGAGLGYLLHHCQKSD